MDLTKQYPRSPYQKVGGCMMLGRTSDKARAEHENALGEYMYDCPLDRVLFEFLGINADDFLAAVKPDETDEEVIAWVKANQTHRDAPEIEAFNQRISQLGPDSDEKRAYFEEIRRKVAPDRPDVRAWFDLIEAEEGRLK